MDAYRYEIVTYSGGVDAYDEPIPGIPQLELRRFKDVRPTKRGFVITHACGMTRFVNHNSRKKYAHLDPVDALQAFIARRTAEERILVRKLETCQSMRGRALQLLTGLVR